MIGDLRLREGAEQERILPQQQVEETPAMRKEELQAPLPVTDEEKRFPFDDGIYLPSPDDEEEKENELRGLSYVRRARMRVAKEFLRLDPINEKSSYAVYKLFLWLGIKGISGPFTLDNFIDKEHPLPHQERTVTSEEGPSMIETFVTLPYGEEYIVGLRPLD
jgi:hypothetical protein